MCETQPDSGMHPTRNKAASHQRQQRACYAEQLDFNSMTEINS
jgi:hypothetical protein